MPPQEAQNSNPNGRDWLVAMVFGLAAATLYFLSRGPFMTDWDSIQFAWGVQDFNLFAHHPHPPGYPLHIWSARLLTLFKPIDVETALSIVSAIGGGIFVGSWWWIFKWQFGARLAWPVTVTLAITPLTMLTANKVLTDAPAAGLMALALAFALANRDCPHAGRMTAAGVAAALATGVRPQNVVFNLAMVFIGG